jgi:hypothetical protein
MTRKKSIPCCISLILASVVMSLAQSGDVFVLRAGPQFERLATNSVGASTIASLAASNGDLFMRTDKGLWCFAEMP